MRFSIITPVYNSSKFLKGLYEEICQVYSVFKDFEWILIDDFSSDNSREIMREIYSKNDKFPIKTLFLDKNYYGTKCTITASEAAQGEYIIILDADDFLTKDSLLIFDELIKKNEHIDNFVGVCGRCVDLYDNFIGTKINSNEYLSNELYVRHILKVKGEMFQCTKKEIIKEYFYGIKPGYTNGWAWSRISLKYSWVYTDQIVRRYNTENFSSVSHSPVVRFMLNKISMDLQYMSTMKNYIFYDLKSWLKKAIVVATGSWICKKIYIGYKEPLYIQVILLLLLPFGGIFALMLLLKNGRKKYLINS